MQVTVDKDQIIQLLTDLVKNKINQAYFSTNPGDETPQTLYNKLNGDNPYGDLIFIPEKVTKLPHIDNLDIINYIGESWVYADGKKVEFKTPGRFLEPISWLKPLKILYNNKVNNWELGTLTQLPSGSVSERLREAQQIAARKVINNYSFIWGPPGTGKTFTCAHILTNLLDNLEKGKVLVTSTSNRAVDEIMDQLIQIRPASDFRVSRYGGTRTDEGQRFDIPRLQKIKATSQDPGIQREQIEKCLSEATIIFANTMAVQTYEYFRSMHFKYVLFDETSMIPAYMVEALRCLYPKAKFIFAGDPMQLPPVIEDENLGNHKYARNIYEYPEIKEQQKLLLEGKDSIISFLDIQSRMHSKLGSAVSHAFYHGKLKSSKLSAPELALNINVDHKNEVYSSGELTILGHKALPSVTNRSVKSNANLLEANFIVDGAARIINAGKFSLMIITPFRNQVELIKTMLKQRGMHNVQVVTVHKAQGSQADIVLFSLAGRPGYNNYVTLRNEDVNEKLINVAFSRAKVQCIVVGSARHLQASRALTKLYTAYIKSNVPTSTTLAKVDVQPKQSTESEPDQADLIQQLKSKIEKLEIENKSLKEKLLKQTTSTYFSNNPITIAKNPDLDF